MLSEENKRPELVRLIHRALAGDFADCFLATEQYIRIEALVDAILALLARSEGPPSTQEPPVDG